MGTRRPAPPEHADRDALIGEMAKQASLGHRQYCLGIHILEGGEQVPEWVEWTEAFAILTAGFARTPESAAGTAEPDSARLEYLLRNALLTLDEDGEHLCLFLNSGPVRDDETAVLIGETPSGDDGELTAEDAPYLSARQLADLNGSVPNSTGIVTDLAAIRAFIDCCLAAHPPSVGAEK